MKKLFLIFTLFALVCLGACGKGEAPPEGALARVGEEYIFAETIENDRLLGVSGTDREIVEGKVLNMLMLLEAENKGLAATEDEIAQFMSSQEQAWLSPTVREQIETMYEPLGIDFESYKAMVLENTPKAIARQKLWDFYAQKYCEKEGIEFTKVNPPAEMEQYADEQMQKLWSNYKGEYEIYID